MKTRFGLLTVALLTTLSVVAQTHITVDDPDTWSGEVLRPYIGQTVIFDIPMQVCANANGKYIVSPWRRFQPEAHGFKDTEEYKSTVRINNTCMFSIDNINDYHRCGEKIIGLQATVNSTNSLTWEAGSWSGNTRADLQNRLPDLGDYRLLVCGFNVENYYLTYGSMGARNASEHQKQRRKVRNALLRINADIYGLVELQQGNEAIDEIMKDLNARLPERNYKYFNDPATGTYQKVDFLYDANKVEPISQTPAKTDAEVKNRKKIMCFRELATGEKFSYSINHFKAMNTGDEERRVNEAKAVIELYNNYQGNKNVRDKDVLIMGDLNCYAFTAPIKQLTDRGMIDLHRAFHADSSYSYMYGGMASYIDHALCNETMYWQITGMSGFHINSDEDDNYNYERSNDTTMFRCSDHDPVLVGLRLDSTLSGAPYFNGIDYVQDSLTFYYPYGPGEENIEPFVLFDIYTVNGFCVCPPKKIQFNGILPETHTKYYTFSATDPNLPDELRQLMPLPSGIYIIHFYYKNTVINHKLIVK